MHEKLIPLFDTLEQIHRGALPVRQGEQVAKSVFLKLEEEFPLSRQKALTDFKTSFINYLGLIERHGRNTSGVRSGVENLRRRADEL